MVTPWRLTHGNEHRDYSNLSHYSVLGKKQSSKLAVSEASFMPSKDYRAGHLV